MHDVQQIQRAANVLQPEDDLLFSVNLYIITKKQGNSCRNCTIAGCIQKKTMLYLWEISNYSHKYV